MPTLKIQKADGTFEFLQLAGEEFADIGNQVLDVKSQLAQKVQQYNVDIMSFGAKCDGITSDHEAIQNAVNSLDRHRGGKIVFPTNSTVLIARPIVITKDNVTFEGNGSKIIMANMGTFQAFNSVQYPHILNNNNARCFILADGTPEYIPPVNNKYDPECYNHKLNNLVIKDFTIQCGTGDGNFMGISIALVDNLRIENVNVFDCKGNGIEVKKCIKPIINNCDFINSRGFSLFLYKTKNAIVEDCYFKNSQNWVVEIKHSYNSGIWVNATLKNNIFEDIQNVVSDHVCIRGGGGFNSHGGTGDDPDGFNHRFVFGCVVENNVFINCNATAIQPTLHSGRWVIKNNKILDHPTAGIKLEGSKSLEYYAFTGSHICDGNTIEFVNGTPSTIANAGIVVTSPNCTVINNTIKKMLYREAIYALNTENVTIENNKLTDSVYPAFANHFIRALNVNGISVKGNSVNNVKVNTIGDMTSILLNATQNFEVISNDFTGITHVNSLSFGTAISILGVSSNGLVAHNRIRFATTGIRDNGDANAKTNVLIRDNIISDSRTITDNYQIAHAQFLPLGGTTANRPANPFSGMLYFDITLGGRLIVYNGSAWVNTNGSAL